MFRISVWTGLDLCLGGVSPPKPPVATGLIRLDLDCSILLVFTILLIFFAFFGVFSGNLRFSYSHPHTNSLSILTFYF